MAKSASASLVIADKEFYATPKQILLNIRNNLNFQKIEDSCEEQRKLQQRSIAMLYEKINR